MVKMFGSAKQQMSWCGLGWPGSVLARLHAQVKADLWMFARMDRSQEDGRRGRGWGLSINHRGFLFIVRPVPVE